MRPSSATSSGRLSVDRKHPFERKDTSNTTSNNSSITTSNSNSNSNSSNSASTNTVNASSSAVSISVTSPSSSPSSPSRSVVMPPAGVLINICSTTQSPLPPPSSPGTDNRRGIAESSPDHFSGQPIAAGLPNLVGREDSSGSGSGSGGSNNSGSNNGGSSGAVHSIGHNGSGSVGSGGIFNISTLHINTPLPPQATQQGSSSGGLSDSSVSTLSSLPPSLQPILSPPSTSRGPAISVTENERSKSPAGEEEPSPYVRNAGGDPTKVGSSTDRYFRDPLPPSALYYDSDSSSAALNQGPSTSRSNSFSNKGNMFIQRTTSDDYSHYAISEVSDGEKSAQMPARKTSPQHTRLGFKNDRESKEPQLFLRRPSSSIMSQDTRSVSGRGGERRKGGGIASSAASVASAYSAVSNRSKISTQSLYSSSAKQALSLQDFCVEATATVDGQEISKRLLYIPQYLSQSLINSDDKKIEGLLKIIGIHDSELVIYLLPSVLRKHVNVTSREYDSDQFSTVRSQLFVFLRSSLLPFIRQYRRRTLIVIDNVEGCLLTSLFSEIALAEQVRETQQNSGFLDGSRPNPFSFQVLLFCNAVKNAPNAKDISLFDPARTSDLNMFRDKLIQSIKGRSRITSTSECSQFSRNRDDNICIDVVSNTVLVVEVVNHASHESGSAKKASSEGFNAEAVQLSVFRWFSMIAKVPVIAFQCLEIQKSFNFLTHLTVNQIPIVMLDSVDNPFTNSGIIKLYPVTVGQTDVSASASGSGSVKCRAVDTVSNVNNDIESAEQKVDILSDSYRLTKSRQRAAHHFPGEMIIGDAITIAESSCLCVPSSPTFDIGAIEGGHGHGYQIGFMNTSALIAIFHSALHFTSMISQADAQPLTSPMNALTGDSSGKVKTMMELECDRLVPSNLVNDILSFLASKRVGESPAAFFNLVVNQNVYPCSLHEERSLIWRLLEELVYDRFNRNLNEANLEAVISLRSKRAIIKKRIAASKKLLVDALTFAELYDTKATRMKFISTLVCFCLLSSCTAVVILTVLNKQSDVKYDIGMIIISFIITPMLAMFFVVNPRDQWQCFRIAALRLRAEVWSFRLQTLKCCDQNIHDAIHNEETFLGRVQGIKSIATLGESSDKNIWNFNFFAPLVNKHSQTRVMSVDIFQKIRSDEVQSWADLLENLEHNPVESLLSRPVTAEMYFALRIQPSLTFFRSKLPIVKMKALLCKSVVVGGSLLYAAFCFFELSRWNSLVAVVVLAAISIFSLANYDSKITRYTLAVNELEELSMWWKSIVVSETQSYERVSGLIEACEDILRREQICWATTPSALKLFSKH